MEIKKILSISWLKNVVLLICVYFIWIMILGEFLSDYGDDEIFYAIPATILSIWIYKDQTRSKQ